MSATERQAFYDRIAPANLAPLWEQLHSLVTPEPTTSCVPALWRYEEIRPHLMQAGGLITAQFANDIVRDHRYTPSLVVRLNLCSCRSNQAA